MPSRIQNVTLENARIIFRNFSGLEGRFNAAGDRNFNVLLTNEQAKRMMADGWNVKFLQPREENDESQPRLEVAVSFKGRPPRVVIITSRGKTALTEDLLAILDWAEIVSADLIIRPYEWEVGGRSGVKAYLQTLFVTIREDELERKYQDVPDTAQEAITMKSEVLAITRGDPAEDDVPF